MRRKFPLRFAPQQHFMIHHHEPSARSLQQSVLEKLPHLVRSVHIASFLSGPDRPAAVSNRPHSAAGSTTRSLAAAVRIHKESSGYPPSPQKERPIAEPVHTSCSLSGSVRQILFHCHSVRKALMQHLDAEFSRHTKSSV